MQNLLLETIHYKVEKTSNGTWRRFLYPNGAYFAEYKSDETYFGLPLIHWTRGISPETGKRPVAKGIIAIGRKAAGVVAIGQFSFGLIALGQICCGLLLGLGQLCGGAWAIGQVALGIRFGLGQLTSGLVAIGQLGVGRYVLAQRGIGEYVWSPVGADPVAVDYFVTLWESVSAWFGLV